MAEEAKKDGRPPELTEDNQTNFAPRILAELEDAFLNDMNNGQACFLANIDESTFYRVLKNNPALADRFKLLKENIKVKAKQVISKAIKEGDKQQSNWYLERRAKDEFSARNELTGADGKELNIKVVNYGDNNSTQLPAPALPVAPISSD